MQESCHRLHVQLQFTSHSVLSTSCFVLQICNRLFELILTHVVSNRTSIWNSMSDWFYLGNSCENKCAWYHWFPGCWQYSQVRWPSQWNSSQSWVIGLIGSVSNRDGAAMPRLSSTSGDNSFYSTTASSSGHWQTQSTAIVGMLCSMLASNLKQAFEDLWFNY